MTQKAIDKGLKQTTKSATKSAVAQSGANATQRLAEQASNTATNAVKTAQQSKGMAYAQKAASSLQMAGSMVSQFQSQDTGTVETTSNKNVSRDWARLNRIRSNKKIMGGYAA